MRILKTILLTPFVLAALWALGYALFTGSVLLLKPARAAEKADAIVVLTGGATRVETGLQLFSEGRAGQLFISGVHPGVSHNNITDLWRGVALPDCCITLDHRATTTLQNAAQTAEWAQAKDIRSLVLVTANYHMNRAVLEFTHVLPGVKIIMHPVVQPDVVPERRRFWILTITEYHKTMFRLFSFIFGLPDSYAEGFKT